jgi:hypothetical protein
VEIKRQRRDGDCLTTVGSIKIVLTIGLNVRVLDEGRGY